MQPPIDRQRYRRETEAAVAAFLAAGGTIKTLPGFRSGALDRHVGKVVGIKRDLNGWIAVVAGSYGQFWAYSGDHPDMKRPKLKSIVTFELAPVHGIAPNRAPRQKAAKLELCNG